MGDYGKLAYTGIPAVTIGGVVFNQWAVIAIAVGLVVGGALLVRFGWRPRKGVNEA